MARESEAAEWKALARLTEDDRQRLALLPEHQRQLCHGLSLWLNGYSVRKAASAADVAPTTLFDAIKRMPNDTDQQRTNVAEIAMPYAIALVHEDGRQALEESLNGSSKMPAHVRFGIATDKLVAIQRTRETKSTDPLLERLLSRMDDGDSASLELKVQRNPIVDVKSKEKSE